MPANYTKSLKTYLARIAQFFFILSLITISLEAQKNVSQADTGRIKWGHADFSGYNRATMCHRALDEATRHYTRRYHKDTSLAPIIKNSSPIQELPKATIETAKACIAHLNMDSQDLDQLWAVARIHLVLGEWDKSKAASEKAIAAGASDEEKLDMKLQALRMYLNHSESTIPLAYHFADMIHSTQPETHVGKYESDISFATYFFIRYNVDSVMKYTMSAIEALKKMSIDDMDKVPAFDAFSIRLEIANESGDIPTQEKILEEASQVVSNWRSGAGGRAIEIAYRGIEVKKTVYNRKITSLHHGVWQNYDGIERPKVGVSTLVVMLNHNCGIGCYSRVQAIKRLKNTFGKDLDVVLITSTMGYAPGSGPLTLQEEGHEAAKYYKDYLELPFPLLVDESPTYKLDDGRIIRDKGPMAQILSDINGTNAIVTDQEGKVQWAGVLNSELQIRLLASVIERAVAKKSE